MYWGVAGLLLPAAALSADHASGLGAWAQALGAGPRRPLIHYVLCCYAPTGRLPASLGGGSDTGPRGAPQGRPRVPAAPAGPAAGMRGRAQALDRPRRPPPCPSRWRVQGQGRAYRHSMARPPPPPARSQAASTAAPAQG